MLAFATGSRGMTRGEPRELELPLMGSAGMQRGLLGRGVSKSEVGEDDSLAGSTGFNAGDCSGMPILSSAVGEDTGFPTGAAGEHGCGFSLSLSGVCLLGSVGGTGGSWFWASGVSVGFRLATSARPATGVGTGSCMGWKSSKTRAHETETLAEVVLEEKEFCKKKGGNNVK
jgi:hypothetical protein